MGSNFVGALAHADDIVLLAPSANVLGLCIMLSIFDSHAKDYSIPFNAGKSKCLVVLSGNRQCLTAYVRFMSETILSNM